MKKIIAFALIIISGYAVAYDDSCAFTASISMTGSPQYMNNYKWKFETQCLILSPEENDIITEFFAPLKNTRGNAALKDILNEQKKALSQRIKRSSQELHARKTIVAILQQLINMAPEGTTVSELFKNLKTEYN